MKLYEKENALNSLKQICLVSIRDAATATVVAAERASGQRLPRVTPTVGRRME